MVRSGLRRVLESEADLNVVAEAGNVDGALSAAREHQPQIVLLDLHMPGGEATDAIPAFLEAAPGCEVVVLTMDNEPAMARAALSAGARGYVLKEAAEEQLVDAVRAVVDGHTYLAPTLGATMVRTEAPAHRPHVSQLDPWRAVGSRFAGHRIDAVLGHGGMGVVFQATDLVLDRVVALKLITPAAGGDRLFRARFAQECRLAASIDHPHAVQIFHAGEEEGLLYLTMRYVHGPDLRRLIRAEERLEPGRAAALVEQVAGALDEAHRLGLVHRDVKPANVLVEARAHGDHAYLSDFGLSKPTSEGSGTQTAFPVGTVDYIAPEQARGGEVDRRADVYSLGCLLFHMLTGDVVFDLDSDLDKLWAHVHEPAPRLRSVNPDLPGALEEVLDHALAKDPDDRQQSAGEFARGALAALSS